MNLIIVAKKNIILRELCIKLNRVCPDDCEKHKKINQSSSGANSKKSNTTKNNLIEKSGVNERPKRARRPAQRYAQVNPQIASGKKQTVSVADVKPNKQTNVRAGRRPRSESLSIETNRSNDDLKSILKKEPAGRRSRSKSVSFDHINVDLTPSPVMSTSNRNAVYNNGLEQSDTSSNMENPIDLCMKPCIANRESGTFVRKNEYSFPLTSGVANMSLNMAMVQHEVELEKDEPVDFISSLENRIDHLFRSNTAKSDRIQELIKERNFLAKQLQTAHRLNLTLTNTIDTYQADENRAPNANVQELEREIVALQTRVDCLNRTNFDLTNENEKLKTSTNSYAKGVLAEHNYNLQ